MSDPHGYFPRVISERDLTVEQVEAAYMELFQSLTDIKGRNRLLEGALSENELLVHRNMPYVDVRRTLYARAVARRDLNNGERIWLGDRFGGQ